MSQPTGLRLLVDLSDLHSGSTAALMPPTFKLSEENEISANPLQRFFWEYWLHGMAWLEDLVAGEPYALVLNGDLIEGDHHRTDEIISRRLTDHVDLAEAILAPVTKRAAVVFITQGTECHTGDREATLGHRLNAQKDPDTGRPVFKRLVMDICGNRLVARHHVTTTSRPWLESNGLGMELASEQLSAVRNGEPMPKILLVAHRHVGGHVVTTNGVCIATPAWQGPTRHTNKVVPAARCKPGIYVLDWRGVPDGSLPKIHNRIYEAPHATAVKV